MTTDHNEAMMLADVCEDESRSNPDDYRWQAAALIRKQAERIAELEARVHTCGPTCSKAGCINRRITAERDTLRAEVERLRVDGERWGKFIGLSYQVRAEWAANLSLVPVLTSWVDSLPANDTARKATQ